jgi:hypothetical protein
MKLGFQSCKKFLESFINQLDDEELQYGYFQQDGATARTAGWIILWDILIDSAHFLVSTKDVSWYKI